MLELKDFKAEENIIAGLNQPHKLFELVVCLCLFSRSFIDDDPVSTRFASYKKSAAGVNPSENSGPNQFRGHKKERLMPV